MLGRRIILLVLTIVLLSGCAASQNSPLETPKPSATVQPTPSPTPEPTPIPTPEPTPEPTPDPYFTQEEEVTVDEENGYWLYRSATLFVQVNRITDKINDRRVTYFVADVRLKEGERERAGFGNPEKPGRSSLPLYKIAKKYQAVIAVNGDYLANVKGDDKGIIMRDGEVIANKGETDTLAFYPDGTLRVFGPEETTPEELLEAGVQNTFSFGPTLIDDGVIMPDLEDHRLGSRKPRTAIGMVEPFHFLLVVVDGRQSSYSAGMTLPHLADLFAQYQCGVAYNLDGGASATMSFMGKNISRYGGSLTGQRTVPDALMFGQTPLLAE